MGNPLYHGSPTLFERAHARYYLLPRTRPAGRRLIAKLLRRPLPSPPWNDAAPVRQELFGIERLEQHAASLAAAQPVSPRPPRVL
ncbi:MAG: hypothetical protein EOO25_15435, partial [Comamonadaceae bacterium]